MSHRNSHEWDDLDDFMFNQEERIHRFLAGESSLLIRHPTRRHSDNQPVYEYKRLRTDEELRSEQRIDNLRLGISGQVVCRPDDVDLERRR